MIACFYSLITLIASYPACFPGGTLINKPNDRSTWPMTEQNIPITRQSVKPGDTIGRLTIISGPNREGRYEVFLCQCVCGKRTSAIGKSNKEIAAHLAVKRSRVQ